ncbi:hypothetical protein A2Y26_03375 [candidate division CPR2 bacterium GWD2_39_7]|nr:MAG: hypothetical protein A2Y26_03375 [candidate division CPR2 bacterium GWD2_39_7]
MGGKVNINGTVTGDVLAAGGDVMLENSGKIEGDMLVASGTAVLDGSVKKDLKVYSGDLKIRGLVGNDVYANASNISVSDTATINGNLKYTSSQSASIDSGSKIKGEVSAQIKKAPGVSVASRIFGFIYGYLAYVFLGTLFLWLFHKPIMRLSDTIYKENGQSFLYGVMAFFLAPIAIIVLFCTVIGIPIAIILLMVYVISILFSKIIVSLAGGRYIFEKLGFHKSEYFVLAGGLFVYLLLSNIPLIGFFVSLITWFLGLGSIFLALRRAHQP